MKMIARFLIVTVSATLLFSGQADAVLGAKPQGKLLKAEDAASANFATPSGGSAAPERFQVYTSTAANGSAIREYVSDNVVFAVAWSGGNTHPDLTQLLGSEYTNYQSGLVAQPKKKGRAPHQVVAGDLIVTKGGHMRDNRGFAYKKSLLPAGVTAADIQ